MEEIVLYNVNVIEISRQSFSSNDHIFRVFL